MSTPAVAETAAPTSVVSPTTVSSPLPGASTLNKDQVEAILSRYTKKKRSGGYDGGVKDSKHHDAASKEIFGSLEDNAAYFLETIKDRVGRYEDNLREVIAFRYPSAMKGAPLDTPLLRRTAMVTKQLSDADKKGKETENVDTKKEEKEEGKKEEAAPVVATEAAAVTTATTTTTTAASDANNNDKKKDEEDDSTPEQTLITTCPKITVKLLRERYAATYGDNYSEADIQAAMEAIAKHNGGKRNRDGTINTNPIEEIDPSVPRPGKTLKAAPRGGGGGGAEGEGETITIDPNDPKVMKALIGAIAAAQAGSHHAGGGGKKDKGAAEKGAKGSAKDKDKKDGKDKKKGGLNAAALAALANALIGGGAGGAGGEDEDNYYEDSEASSGIDVADDCAAPEIELPDHSPLVQAYAALKKECYEVGITFQGLHDWIMFNAETAAEEKEREAEVAENVGSQVEGVQEQIDAIYDGLGTYLEARTEAEKSVLNYPHVTSFHQALLSADDDAWLEVERSWREMIRLTLFTYYLISNNLESLVAVASPTGTGGASSIYH